jgi:hypothetical protein
MERTKHVKLNFEDFLNKTDLSHWTVTYNYPENCSISVRGGCAV